MSKKVSFVLFSKAFNSFTVIWFTLMSFPAIALFFIENTKGGVPTKIFNGIFYGIPVLAAVFSIIAIFLGRKKTTMLDLLSPIIYLPILFLPTCIEAIYLGYDNSSKNPYFYVMAVIFLIASTLLIIFWYRCGKRMVKAEKSTKSNDG